MTEPFLSPDRGETGIVQRLRASLAEAGLDDAPHVLVGFSGGADSLALLVGLRSLARLGLVRLTAVHVDHAVREISGIEASQVVRLAQDLGVACERWVVDPVDLARHRGVGMEEALRRERYRAFSEIGARVAADVVATGHHQRDQAETVLLHLLRGAGLRGVSGMRSLTELTVPWWDDAGLPVRTMRLWRPLLDEPVDVLHDFVQALELPVIEDSSNYDSIFRRNAIRHEVLPVLERVMPGAVANLAGFAHRAAEDDDALETIVADALAAAREGTGLRLDAVALLPAGLQRRLLRRWVLDQAPQLELSSQRVDALRRALLRREGGKRIQLGAGWLGVVGKGQLRLEREP